MTKATYRIKNWSSYNKSLIARGSINLWIDDKIQENWFYSNNRFRCRKVGSPATYSDFAIELCLIVRATYKLPLRMTYGFLKSIFIKTDLALNCPYYSTMSRRGKKLNLKLKRYQNLGSVTDIVVDSTGIKVFGEGEWKVRQHGIDKRRAWRKFHIAADPLSHEVLAQELTSNKVTDDKLFKNLIDQIPEQIERAFGDGAYDKIDCYDACRERGIIPIIPPQKKAILQDEMQKQVKRTDSKIVRDNHINRIRELERTTKDQEITRKEWKIEFDYHVRSLAETTMFRYKKIFGDRLLSRNFDNQKTEMLIKTNILNKFTSLGMPESWPVYG